METVKQIMKQTIDLALKNGADSCDIILNNGENISLAALNGKLDKFKISKTQDLGIRVIKDQKIGLAYTESFDQDALEFTVKNALANAEFSTPNEFETISVKNPQDLEDIIAFADTSSIEDKISLTLELESIVKRLDKRVESAPYNGLSSSTGNHFYMNSLGTFTHSSDNSISVYTSSLVKENDKTSIYYEGAVARKLKDLDIEKIAKTCLTHSVNWLTADAVDTGMYDVIFSVDVQSSLLGAFRNHLNAKSAMEKTNPWSGKLGEKVAHESLTIMDLPMYKDAFSKDPFDSEGNKRVDLTLIENGVLKSFYHNSVTAKFFNTKNTFHAARGARGPLGVSATTMVIKEGATPEVKVKEGLYLEIISQMGIGPGTNNINGTFSFGASGYLCKDGVRIQPVKGITIAGTINDLLTNIKVVGDTMHSNEYQSSFSPLIRFSNLSVAGK